MRIHLLLPSLRLCLLLVALVSASAGARALPTEDGLYAVIGVPEGTIVCKLDPLRAPLTCANFVGLAEGTLGPLPRKPFFDGLKFHRVVPGFVIQGGDPLGTGEGGPGYTFPDEFSPELHHDRVGVLSMANEGPDTNGSQFFITLRAAKPLDFLHSVFGRTVEGIDVLAKVRQGDAMTVRILRVGAEARAFKANDERFAQLRAQARPPLALKPGTPPLFEDPDHLLPQDPPWPEIYGHKLANLERFTGVKLRFRVFAHFTPTKDVPSATAKTQALARELGTDRDAILAVYYQDLQFWDLWIAEDCIGSFVGEPGTVEQLMRSGALHRTKHGLIDAAHVEALLKAQEAVQHATPTDPVTPAKRLRYQIDALLEGLIQRLTV